MSTQQRTKKEQANVKAPAKRPQRQQGRRRRPPGPRYANRPDRRRPQRQTQKEKPEDVLISHAGAHGSNVLALEKREIAQDTLAAVNQDSQKDVNPATTNSVINMLAIGILLAAKKRGLNTIMDESFQFHALNYLVSVIRSAIQGTTLEFTSAPRWFVEILHAVRPKAHRALTASAYYEMGVGDIGPPLSPVYPLGTGDEVYSLAFGPPSTPIFNGFKTVFTGYVYDPALGAEWFSKLWAVFPSVPGTPSEHVPPTIEAYNKKDCSAFAMVTSRMGSGFFTPGGVNNFLENEVHIDSPILARFCSDNEVTEAFTSDFRAGFNYGNGGGTICYLGPRCREFTKVSQFRNKARQVFKFYDLYEFYEVFSLIIGGVLERATKQSAIATSPYPLTAQRTMIMLRQALLPFFCNEMAQDLRLKNPSDTDPGIRKYLPCTVADNGVSITALTVSPLMPKFFTEMVKGVSRIVANVDKTTTLEESRSVMDWIPVLSIRSGSAYNTYTYQSGEDTLPVYAVDPAEEPVNLLDASLVSGPITYYLNLNGDELQEIINAHNTWMTAHQPFMTGLSKLSSATGSPLFSSIISTRLIKNIDIDVPPVVAPVVATAANPKKMEKQNSKLQVKGSSIVKQRVRQVLPVPTEGGTFQGVGAYLLQSNLPFVKELQKYQMLLVAPVFSSIDVQAFAANSNYVQALYGEYISIPYGSTTISNTNSSSDIPSLFSLHSGAAELDLKNVAGSGENEIETLVDELEKKGQGGFLAFLSKVLTTGGKLATSVGEMMG